MRTNSISRRLAALVLALVMAVSLAACGGSGNVDIDNIDVGDEITAPAPEGIPGSYRTGGNKDKGSKSDKAGKSNKDDSDVTGSKDCKPMTKTQLKPYGELITLVKSVSKPTKPDSKNISDSNYGKVDYSMSAQGYVEFTAKTADRIVILQGPEDSQAMMCCEKDETIKIALTDGAGKYQYAIGVENGKTVKVQYKDSFNVKAIDSELAPYLVSTPYGDYENAPNTVKQASELWDVKKTRLDNIKAIAKWVSDTIKYDKAGKFGTIDVYVNPDKVLENGKGVCNEMAKTLTAALRSQGIPAYMQNGINAKGGAHGWVVAWIEFSSETKDGVTYSTGTWVVIESTFGYGALQPAKSAERNYTPSAYRG